MIMEARMQAELLYSLRAIARYMTWWTSRKRKCSHSSVAVTSTGSLLIKSLLPLFPRWLIHSNHLVFSVEFNAKTGSKSISFTAAMGSGIIFSQNCCFHVDVLMNLLQHLVPCSLMPRNYYWFHADIAFATTGSMLINSLQPLVPCWYIYCNNWFHVD